jgi:hypothetical protein
VKYTIYYYYYYKTSAIKCCWEADKNDCYINNTIANTHCEKNASYIWHTQLQIVQAPPKWYFYASWSIKLAERSCTLWDITALGEKSHEKSSLSCRVSWYLGRGGNTFRDSATLQSMQWIINAAYNQRSLQSMPLYTVWINHQIWGLYLVGAPAHFSYCKHNIRGLGLKWRWFVWCVDYPLRSICRSRAHSEWCWVLEEIYNKPLVYT